MEKGSEQNIESAVARNEQCSLVNNKAMTMANHLATSKSYNNVRKFDGRISQYEQPTNNSGQSRKFAEPEYEEDRRNVPLPVTHWHAPAGQSASIPILTSQDYPPPRPVIPNFDGDPLTYWPFIRTFEAHIATKMSSNSAKLVYLLQHCSTRIRQNLEHLARDAESGYGLAMDSLYNDYGQPHIVAHHCEQKLLAAPRLKTKDPKGLKTLSVLMDKCVAMLRDVQGFATLNSLGTIRRIIEKLPEQTQKDWAKWSYHEFKTTGRQARFEELVRFVQDEAAKANSLYGQVVYGNLKQSLHVGQRGATVLSTTAIPDFTPKTGNLTCPFCDGKHELSACTRFKKLRRYKRIAFLMKQGRCFQCLDAGLTSRDCKSNQRCNVEGCTKYRHHTLLHKDNASGPADSEKVLCAATKNIYSDRDSSGHFFMTLPVKICHNGKELLTYALLDSGSQRTFCTRRIADELNANGSQQTISISTLSSGVQPTPIETEAITLLVSGVDENCNVSLREVLAVDAIPLKAAQVPVSSKLNNLEHLKDISFKELSDKTIGLLIGVDASVVFRALESRFGPEGTPDAIRTSLGWVLFGPALRCQCCAEVRNNSATDTCMHVILPENAKIDPSLPPHEYEVGCGLDHDNSREDRLALKIMKDSIKIVNGHFQLPLLWRHKNVFLPDNRAMAEKRLESLKRRLSKDESLHKKYAGVMQNYIEKGYAEKVRDDGKKNACTWFLPHHPVMNPKKPDKLRVVFECAAKFMGVSLNDKLLQGPDLLSRLSGVLTRFRLKPIALVADIEAMFHQVKVSPEDRSALQFLWWPDGDVDKRPEVYRMTVHLFGATSSPSCASFCLKQTAALFAENCSSQTIEAIQRAFYVDDCLMSVETSEEAADLANELRNALSSYGFRLRKWLSNCERALLKVPEEDRCEKYKELSLERTTSQGVLGVHWDIVVDEFRIKVDMPRKPCTRRGILSASHSLFDPLGFVAPALVEIKLLLREMNGDDWDAALPEKKEERWRAWISALYYLEELKIPRCLKLSDMNGELTYELHHFSDASGEAYGAVSYLRIADKSGKVHCSFLMGKSHLAPAPMTTIPRLELLAAIVSLRLDQMLKKELLLVIEKTYFWSDSTSVLLSIYNSNKRFPVFVANRLAEIERNSDIQSWRYVPSKLNPADEAT